MCSRTNRRFITLFLLSYPLTTRGLFMKATCERNLFHRSQLSGHNGISTLGSKVDIDDISLTSNASNLLREMISSPTFSSPYSRRKRVEIRPVEFTHHMLLHDIATRAATQQRLSEQAPQRRRFILFLKRRERAFCSLSCSSFRKSSIRRTC